MPLTTRWQSPILQAMRHGCVVGVASVCLAACGTTVSSHYGEPYDTGTDAATTPDEALSTGDDALFVGSHDASPPRDVPAVDAGHGAPYPIVLHHGFAGFNQFVGVHYFYDVAADLTSRGETVVEAEVSPFDTTPHRAVQLATFIDGVLARTGSAKVVLIAHSQGGLDARYLISTLGYGDRVALLTTVATPHRGTRVADAILGLIPGFSDVLLSGVATLFGSVYNDVRGNADLTGAAQSLSVDASSAFNAQNPDDPRVVYWSWAGRSNWRDGAEACGGAHFANDPMHVDAPFVALQPFASFLEQGDAAHHVNDGLVEVSSARWGVFMGCIPGDHFDEVGQIAESGPDLLSRFDHVVFYRTVVQLAHGAGF